MPSYCRHSLEKDDLIEIQRESIQIWAETVETPFHYPLVDNFGRTAGMQELYPKWLRSDTFT
jgi:hypothetical protein